MKSGVAYVTAARVKFTKMHPYQLVSDEEADTLIATGRFRIATPEEVKQYYEDVAFESKVV